MKHDSKSLRPKDEAKSSQKELVWKEFDLDDIPQCDWIWASDFKSTWLVSPQLLFPEEGIKYIWSEAHIEYPQVPKNEKHYCHRKSSFNIWQGICYEGEGDTLFLQAGENIMPVDYCPFCGYKPEAKA